MSFAKITLMGHIGRDAETNENQTVLNCPLAVNRYDKSAPDSKATDWYKLSFFGKSIDTGMKFFKKGKRILVEGEPQIQKYDDKEGNERTIIAVAVGKFTIIDFDDKPNDNGSRQAPNRGSVKDVFEDDLPF